MESELWTVEELARRWRLKPSWLYQHMGELPHIKLGNLVRFDPQELESFLVKARRGPAATAASAGDRLRGNSKSATLVDAR